MLDNRRQFIQRSTAAACAAASCQSFLSAATGVSFQWKYLLGTCLYGYEPIANILPEVAKTGAAAIDIWPKIHGSQREQLDEMGEPHFAKLLANYDLKLGCITQYKLGPFGLRDEMRLAQRLGCSTIVTGAVGPKNLKGAELKKAVGEFIEKLKPHLTIAEETGVTIAIENHANNLIDAPDSLRYLADLSPTRNLAIAFAPYHLPQDEALLEKLLRDVIEHVAVFYAWEHGRGCMTKLPKEEELLQLPGRGKLDFAPLVSVLKQANYRGWTEIFMHPFPRGIPILETPAKVTAEINAARAYLEKLSQS